MYDFGFEVDADYTPATLELDYSGDTSPTHALDMDGTKTADAGVEIGEFIDNTRGQSEKLGKRDYEEDMYLPIPDPDMADILDQAETLAANVSKKEDDTKNAVIGKIA